MIRMLPTGLVRRGMLPVLGAYIALIWPPTQGLVDFFLGCWVSCMVEANGPKIGLAIQEMNDTMLMADPLSE